MRTPFRILICFLLASTGSALRAQPEALLYPEEVFPELTALLQTAFEHAPELDERGAAVEERRGQSLSSSAASRSRITAQTQVLGGYEMRYNPDSGDDEVSTFEGRPRVALNASVWWQKPIYYWGNNARQQKIADLYVTASELEYAEASRRHLTSVRENYLKWIAARHQREVAEENITLAERFVADRRRLLEIGRTSEHEILGLEARLQEALETLALYSREEAYYRNQLKLMVGDVQLVDRLEAQTFPDFPLLSVEQIDHLGSALLESETDVPLVEREATYAEADRTYYEAVRREQRPTVDLVAGVTTDRVDSYNIGDNAFRLSSYAGLQVRWNIFDGWRNQGQRMAALARQRSREARIEMTEAEMRSQVERLLGNLKLNLRQVESRTTRANMLERRMRLAENPDTTELVAPIDRLELRLDLLEAQARVYGARVEYLENMGRLAALHFADPISGL